MPVVCGWSQVFPSTSSRFLLPATRTDRGLHNPNCLKQASKTIPAQLVSPIWQYSE